ncbi:unnamed protein product [Dibothriocephalus latus]|uniref:Gelsolin-like domain-containing protein n=1 Tax=Dibothriocephalus latus TaxID=60516 RepID=A0A3P7LES0_DIBLA|nr:unnamed protein product [Dibothriocephalus latus]
MSFFSNKPRPAEIVERKVHGKAVSEWDYILDIKEETLIAWCLTGGNPVRIPDEDVGYFFSDDIFVVVKTFIKNGKIVHNIHFWIGEDKSDEMKRSPQKQVEQLMSVLDDNAVLFREIEGHESPQFKQYFKVFG